MIIIAPEKICKLAGMLFTDKRHAEMQYYVVEKNSN